MTRINSAINVKLLIDEHLKSEHREIIRMVSFYHRTIGEGKKINIPNKFTLNTGHMKFFVNKQRFLYKRYLQIYLECINRGINVQLYASNWDSIDLNKSEDYSPTDEERLLLIERITERIKHGKSPEYHYYGKKISKEQAINLLYESK